VGEFPCITYCDLGYPFWIGYGGCLMHYLKDYGLYGQYLYQLA
jgi:hypothetical protein